MRMTFCHDRLAIGRLECAVTVTVADRHSHVDLAFVTPHCGLPFAMFKAAPNPYDEIVGEHVVP